MNRFSDALSDDAPRFYASDWLSTGSQSASQIAVSNMPTSTRKLSKKARAARAATPAPAPTAWNAAEEHCKNPSNNWTSDAKKAAMVATLMAGPPPVYIAGKIPDSLAAKN